MKKFVSMFAYMAAIVLGAFTFASCGDDEDIPSSPSSESKVSYDEYSASVTIEREKYANPFLTDLDAEKKVHDNLVNIMNQELSKIPGVISKNGYYCYDDSKRSEITAAIEESMTKLEPTLQNQDLYLDGKITCKIYRGSGMVTTVWNKTFNYKKASNHFTDGNGVKYCVISDTEAGVVENDTERGHSAYSGDIVIPETVVNDGKTYTITTIGPRTFYGSSVTSVSLPKTITTLYNNCFGFTKELKSLTLPGKLKYYKFDYKADGTEMEILHQSGITELVLAEGITSMYKEMFWEVPNLKKVVLPSTITEIPKGCFIECRELSEVIVNGALTNVGEYGFCSTGISDLSSFKFKNATFDELAFGSCQKFENIVIPEGVSSLGKQCFSDCYSVVSVTIPASVTSMGINVFAQCKKLKDIHVKGDKPATLEESERSSDAFSMLDFAAQGITIYVPSASVDAYKSASVWSKYADYIKGEE